MNTVKVKVDLRRVHIPALSTIGYGYGRLEDGTSAVIIADRREMEGIGREIGEGKPPIVVYAEVVATGEIADDIAEQWHDQWAISDTESDLDQSLPAPEDVPVPEPSWDERREAEAARVLAAARAEREAAWATYEEAQARAVAAINQTTAERRRRDAAAMGAAGVTHVKVLTSADACSGLSVGCALPASPRHGPVSPDRRLHIHDLSLRLSAGTGAAPTAEARMIRATRRTRWATNRALPRRGVWRWRTLRRLTLPVRSRAWRGANFGCAW